MITQRFCLPADDVVTGPAGVTGADFKARAIDDAVNFIFDAINHQAFFSDALNALAIGVDQGHIGSIEGRQIIIIERRPFAEHFVIRFELFRNVIVFHQLINAGADFFHLLEVRHLDHLLKAHVGIGLCILELIDHLANEVGPAIVHQVLFLGNARDHRVKVFHTVFLPTGLQTLCPGGVSG